MKKSERFIGISVIIILIIITSVFLIKNLNEKSSKHFIKDQSELSQQTENQLIGGQRDNNGCLTPEGYSYNTEIQECLKTWELNQDKKKQQK